MVFSGQDLRMNDIFSEVPFLIHFEKFGNAPEGFLISTQAETKLPFAVKRIFWVLQVPENRARGNHANFKMQEIVVAVQGKVHIKIEGKAGTQDFLLQDPTTGLYIPPKCWVNLRLSDKAILLCLGSTDYQETDYIRDYHTFKKLLN